MKIDKIASSAGYRKGRTIPKLLNFSTLNFKKSRNLSIRTIRKIFDLENSEHSSYFTISKNGKFSKFRHIENYQNSMNLQFYKYKLYILSVRIIKTNINFFFKFENNKIEWLIFCCSYIQNFESSKYRSFYI